MSSFFSDGSPGILTQVIEVPSSSQQVGMIDAEARVRPPAESRLSAEIWYRES